MLLPPHVAWGQTVRIGEMTALTGGVAPYGSQVHNARLIAIDEINARGGVSLGGTRRKLELVPLDVGKPTDAIKVFERLLSVEKVKIVLDGIFSSVEYALAPVIKDKDVVVIWSGGNDPGTTVGVPNAFRNHFDGGLPLMKVSEQFLRKMGVKRAAALGQKGHSDFERFVSEYLPAVKGIEVVSVDWHNFGEKDFFPILTKIKDLKPDAVLTHGFYTDGTTMLRQAREIGLFPGPLWLAQYGAGPLLMDDTSRKVWEGSYEGLMSSYGATVESPAKSKKLFETYSRRFGEQGFGPWVESGYDSVHIVAKAIEKAGTADDTARIIKALHELKTDEIPELLLPYKPGLLFDKEGQAYPRVIIAQWKNGQFVPVYADYGQ
jgi:branched-chain amino acid transport system substrate-binding protein